MKFRYQSVSQIHDVWLERNESGFRGVVDGVAYEFEVIDNQPGLMRLRIGDRIETLYWAIDGNKRWVVLDGCTYLLEKPSLRQIPSSEVVTLETKIRAPMPAKVRSIDVKPGDRIEIGQSLMLLEVMKMEIRIQAPISGIVEKILAKVDEAVERDQLLMELNQL